MELGEWIGGRIIENSDNRELDDRGSTVSVFHWVSSIEIPFFHYM